MRQWRPKMARPASKMSLDGQKWAHLEPLLLTLDALLHTLDAFLATWGIHFYAFL